MGASKQEALARGQRPSGKPKQHAKRKEDRQRLRGDQAPATWAMAEADTLHRLVLCLTERGALVSFGKTRDGGALFLQVFDDGTPRREYFRPSDPVEEILGEIIKDWTPPEGIEPKLPL